MNKKTISDFLNILDEISITPESLNPNKDTRCPVFVFDPTSFPEATAGNQISSNDNNLHYSIVKNLSEASKNFNKENVSNENRWMYNGIRRCITQCKNSITDQLDFILNNYKFIYIYNFINLCSINLNINIAADTQLYNIIMNKVIDTIENNSYISAEYTLNSINGDFRIDDIDWIAFVNSLVMNFECVVYNFLSEIGGLILISAQNKTMGNGNIGGEFIINDIINTIIYKNHGNLIYTIDTNLQSIIKEITEIVNNSYFR